MNDWKAVRARMWLTPSRDLWGRRSWVAHYAVLHGGMVVLYDNAGVKAWRRMYDEARVSVEVLRHMVVAGHPLRPYTGHYSLPEVSP